jgi:hypothetical protein
MGRNSQTDKVTVNSPGVGSSKTGELFARRKRKVWREQWDSRRGLERHNLMLHAVRHGRQAFLHLKPVPRCHVGEKRYCAGERAKL